MYRNVSNVTRMGEKQLSNYKKVRGEGWVSDHYYR